MARKSGKTMLVKTGTLPSPTTILLQGDCTLSITRDPYDVSTKDDDYNVYVAGRGNWTVSFSGQLDTAQATHDALFTDIDTSVEQDLVVAVDDENHSGKAFCTSLSYEGGNEGGTSFSVDYQGSGDPTKS